MELEDKVNSFLNGFFNFHHEINNLLFDNLESFMKLYSFLFELTNDFKECEDLDVNQVTRMGFLDKMKLVEDFYKEYNIDINLWELISNGTIDITFNSLEEVLRDNDYDLLFKGYNGKINKFKTIEVYDNQLITDSIILVHELSHYRNQPDGKRNQVNDLLTEALAFSEELIYVDYLNDHGYQADSDLFKKSEFQNLCNVLTHAYPLLTIYYLYARTGSISKKNYELVYKTLDDYDYCLEVIDKYINNDWNMIFNVLWYMVAFALSIYMYISFKDDSNFIENIKLLNDNLNNLSLDECLGILNLDKDLFSSSNKEKIKNAFSKYKLELENGKEYKK